MRNYNFRKYNKSKEQARREFISNIGCFPTVPKRAEDESGNIYYVQGCKSNYKQTLKRIANKKVRRSKPYETRNGGHYKKMFGLQWEWY